MNFLRRLFKSAFPKDEIPLEDEPPSDSKDDCLDQMFNWEAYQSILEKYPTASIGGFDNTYPKIYPSGLSKDFRLEEFRVFSPSGRYIMASVYSWYSENHPENNQRRHIRHNATGIPPLLAIIDVADKIGRLYANEKFISNGKEESENELMALITLYWISDVQFVAVYVKNDIQLVQCVCTIDHKTCTFRDEIFENGEMETELYINLLKNKNIPNPLFIDNKAYFTVLLDYIFYLLPWMPSTSTNNMLQKIRLNTDDPLFQDYSYFLVAEENAFHFCYGERAFFYFGIDDDERPGFGEDILAFAKKFACIDFSKHKHIDLTADQQLPFEVVYFTEVGKSEYSTRGNVAGWIIVSNQDSNRILSLHGRFVLYESNDDDDGYIFDLENMKCGIIDSECFEDTETICSNRLFKFDPPHREQFAVTRIDQFFSKKPILKSLATICREKLIYSNTPLNVHPKMLDIIFPSP